MKNEHKAAVSETGNFSELLAVGNLDSGFGIPSSTAGESEGSVIINTLHRN
jgi:hypothetical protein